MKTRKEVMDCGYDTACMDCAINCTKLDLVIKLNREHDELLKACENLLAGVCFGRPPFTTKDMAYYQFVDSGKEIVDMKQAVANTKS